ncbi:MAG TPA: PAS domain-containing sensor histidine kinase [Puia sp.]|jgi:PAS domain S-box-containing protein
MPPSPIEMPVVPVNTREIAAAGRETDAPLQAIIDRLEQKLKTSEARLYALIEKGTDIIVIANGEGKITYSSPSIEHYFGVGSEENFGKNAFEYIHPEDMPLLAEQFLEVLTSPGRPIAVQTRARTTDGRLVWLEGTVTNWLGTEGIDGIVCNFRDVTQRVNMEKQILQASIDAQEKEREEIGRELHDNVNRILTTARLYLGCIHSETPGQRHIIDRSSEIITSAIEEIRKLSKTMTQSFHKEVGLMLSLEDLVENIRRLADNTTITLDFSLPVEQILDDKLKMTIFRIVQEQLNNVLKHAGASRIDLSIRQEEDSLQLVIADDGKGFDPREKRKGIGLSNIITRAEVFNGQVSIDSSPGKGCRMTVKFVVAFPEKGRQPGR